MDIGLKRFLNADQAAIAGFGPEKPRHKLLVSFHIMAAYLSLTLYLGFFTPIGFCTAALVGSFDSAHQVCLRYGAPGIQLVLHHHGSCVGHRHGVVAGALTIFTQPVTPANPDHVIQFGSDNNLALQATTSMPPRVHSEQATLAVIAIFSTGLPPAVTSSERPCPPSDEHGKLLCLRSTVLRI